MAKYTHEQAAEAAERMRSLYGFYVGVNDCNPRPEDTWEAYSFIGIHPDENGPCVFVADEELDIEAMRKMAYIIVQTDQDLSQDEPIIENIKDTPGGVREMTGDIIDAGNFIARSLGEIPLRDTGQYY